MAIALTTVACPEAHCLELRLSWRLPRWHRRVPATAPAPGLTPAELRRLVRRLSEATRRDLGLQEAPPSRESVWHSAAAPWW